MELYTTPRGRFKVEKRRLKDVVAADCRANPFLWFGYREIEKGAWDVEVSGVRTKRECLSHLGIAT